MTAAGYPPIRAPHCVQNFAPGAAFAPQCEQNCGFAVADDGSAFPPPWPLPAVGCADPPAARFDISARPLAIGESTFV